MHPFDQSDIHVCMTNIIMLTIIAIISIITRTNLITIIMFNLIVRPRYM